MKNSVRAALAAVVLVLSTLTLQAPASAAEKVKTGSCKAVGFTGYARVTYDGSTVKRVEYRINKGKNKGGNKANVVWTDAVLPNRVQAKTGDNGKQDNKWHTLREKDYKRSTNRGATMQFTFDTRGHDPMCVAIVWKPS